MDFIIEFDYEACEPDELTLKKGDIIKNARIYEEGWMIGTLNGKEGVFPDNFGKEYKEKEPAKKESTDESNRESNTTDEELDDKPVKKKVKGVGLGDIFGGKPIVLKPTNYANHAKKDEEEHKAHQKPTEQVKVLYKYVADNRDELSLEAGEIITLLNKDTGDDGWWLGRNSNGKTGVFPDNYVEVLSKPSSINEEKNVSPSATSGSNQAPVPKYANKPTHNPSSAKTPPPTTAPKPTPARPRPLDPHLTPSNSIVSSKGRPKPSKPTTEEQGISFDSQHVPLVGPNAGRVRGPGKRPTNINNVLSTNIEDPADLKEFITPIATGPTFSSNTTASKNVKSSHSISEKHAAPAPPIGTSKSRSSKDSVDVVEDNTGSQLNTSAVNSKSHSLGRLAKLSPNTDANNNNAKVSITDHQDVTNAKIGALEKRVSSLEETNTDLTRQLAELRRIHNDQVALLTNKVHKLVKELDEDKAKRATSEIELKRIKDTVEDLENALLTRSSN